MALYLAFGYVAHLLVHIIAIAYPLYASIKAVESNEAQRQTKWLTYWVIFCSFLK
jgi:receptor expression-enhancing protein 5/6